MRALAVCLMVGVTLMLGGCGTPSDKRAAKEACQRECAEQFADCQATNGRHCQDDLKRCIRRCRYR